MTRTLRRSARIRLPSSVEHAATLERLVSVLSEREREVLRLRFEDDLTQSEISARVGVSQMHVSRLLRGSIARLQAEAEADPPRRGF